VGSAEVRGVRREEIGDVIQAGRGRTIDARDDARDRGGGRERAAIEAAAGIGDLEDRRGLELLWPHTFVRDKQVIQDIDQRVPPRQRESSRHQVLDVSPTLAVLSLSQVALPAQVLCVI